MFKRREVIQRTYGNTREHHPSVYAEISSHKAEKKPGECSTQLTLEESASKGTKYSSSSSQAKELNKVVTYFIAKDALPVSIISKPGFKHLISKLNPRYEVPSRKHFSEYEIQPCILWLGIAKLKQSLHKLNIILPLLICGQVGLVIHI